MTLKEKINLRLLLLYIILTPILLYTLNLEKDLIILVISPITSLLVTILITEVGLYINKHKDS